MNTLKHFYLFLFLVLATTLVGCNDDDEPSVKTNMEMLTAGVWTGNQVLSDGQDVTEAWKNGTTPWDISKYSLNFFEDGTYTYTYSGNTQEGIWRFTRGEQYIRFNNAEEVEIATLTSNKLHLIYDREGGIAEEHRFVR